MLFAFFEEDGTLRRDAFSPQIEAAVGAGASGIAVLGLGTEAGKLTAAEKRDVVDLVVAEVAGRLPVAVTVGETSLGDSIGFARAARSAGAAWLILQPPRPPLPAGQLLRYFGAVAEAVDCSVGIQNAPEFLGVGLSTSELTELNRVQANVDIVKAESNALAVGNLIDALDGRMAVFNGRGGLELTDNLRAGVDGMIPGTETVDLQTRIETAMRNGDDAEAEALYRKLLPALVFAMQGIEHFLLHAKLLAAKRLGLRPSGQRIPSDTLTRRGEEWVTRLAAELGPLAN